MNHSDQDRIFNEILAGEELNALRRRSLDRGIASLRQRWRRRALRDAALACLPLVVALTFLFWRNPAGKQIALPPAHSIPVSNPQTLAARSVKTITDEELFALFPNRPMALVGKPGHQEVVFLDQPAPLVQRRN